MMLYLRIAQYTAAALLVGLVLPAVGLVTFPHVAVGLILGFVFGVAQIAFTEKAQQNIHRTSTRMDLIAGLLWVFFALGFVINVLSDIFPGLLVLSSNYTGDTSGLITAWLIALVQLLVSKLSIKTQSNDC